MQRSDQKGYFPSMFYGDIINKSKKFKSETSKDFDLVLICHYLRQVYFAKYIDNLPVQLVDKTDN
jgi:hypothetical protein